MLIIINSLNTAKEDYVWKPVSIILSGDGLQPVT